MKIPNPLRLVALIALNSIFASAGFGANVLSLDFNPGSPLLAAMESFSSEKAVVATRPKPSCPKICMDPESPPGNL